MRPGLCTAWQSHAQMWHRLPRDSESNRLPSSCWVLLGKAASGPLHITQTHHVKGEWGLTEARHMVGDSVMAICGKCNLLLLGTEIVNHTA